MWKSLSLVWICSPWNSPGQWIFPTQGSQPGLPHYRQILYRLSHQGNSKMRGLKKNMIEYQLDSCTFMTLGDSILFFFTSEQELLSVGRQILRNAFHVQMCLLFPINSFPLHVFENHSLHNLPHHHILLPERHPQMPGYVINIFYGCCPILVVQNCWAIMHCQLVLLMPLRVLLAITTYKSPTASQYLEICLHFTACPNNSLF